MKRARKRRKGTHPAKRRRRRAEPPPKTRCLSPGGSARAGPDGRQRGRGARRGKGLVAAQIRERIENLRLLTAVASEIPAPTSIPGLGDELEGLAEYDRLLTLGLDVWDREGEPEDPLLHTRQMDLFRIGAHIRANIRALLPWEARARVQTAARESDIEEADAWADVEGLRRSGRDVALLLPGGFGPNGTDPLPTSGTLEPWLRWLPPPWLRTIAAQHGAPRLRTSELLSFALRVLRDEQALAACLRTRLRHEDRCVLVRFTAAGEMLRATLTPEEEADLAPDWDGNGNVPEGHGVRLRALGLLHLGTRDSFIDVVTQPQEMRVRLSRLFLAHHPAALEVLGPRRREYLEAAAALQGPWDLGD